MLGEWDGKNIAKHKSRGQGKKIYILQQKSVRALNSKEYIKLTAQKCEDVFAGMEF